MAHIPTDGEESPAPILTGAFSVRHVSPAIMEYRIFELTRERDALQLEVKRLREMAGSGPIAKPEPADL